MKPIIGLLAEIDNRRNTKVQHGYALTISNAGGIPVLLPQTDSLEAIKDYIDLCDGFLFTGGADVSPARYGEEARPTLGKLQPLRDEFEFRAFEAIFATTKPILAICRGAQLINVALGGSLYQDLPDEFPSSVSHNQTEPKNLPSHPVRVIPETPLACLLGDNGIKANSFHHQAVKVLGKGLRVMATAEDGIIEAFYLDSERYLRAYQWHPERISAVDKGNRLVFSDFIAACSKSKNMRG